MISKSFYALAYLFVVSFWKGVIMKTQAIWEWAPVEDQSANGMSWGGAFGKSW
jgi:hypothetical protein